MESCGPHSSRSDAVSSTSREPKSSPPTLPSNGSYRAAKDSVSSSVVAWSSGVSDDSAVKGTARLAALRQPAGSSDATSSIVIAAVRQLEQRLECEHRHTERQFQRLERQVEELTKVPHSGGRWAELQGYVDGLAETVQTLVKRSEEASMGVHAQGESMAVAACGDHASLTALRMRVDGLEDRQAQADKNRDMKTKEQHQHVCERLQTLSDRILETEQGLASILASSRRAAAEAASSARETERREEMQMPHQRAIDDRVEPIEATAVARTLDGICEELACFAARLEVAESVIHRGSTQSIAEDSAQHGEDFGSATSSRQFFETEELQEQVDELRCSADEQLEEMRDHLHDLEGRLQDLQLDQDVRHEASHVGEQVFRLAMRMQRLDNHEARNMVSIEEARELHAELGELSEQLVHLASRLTHAERGLSSMAEGFDRVCEELANMRSEEFVETGHEQASRESMEKDVNDDSKPLHHKVREMERSHDTMAEVVWQLKKEVSGLRTNFATLQPSIIVEEGVASGVSESPGCIRS